MKQLPKDIIGIDPGMNGGIFAKVHRVNPETGQITEFHESFKMPTITNEIVKNGKKANETEIDYVTLIEILTRYKLSYDDTVVYLEKVGAIRGDTPMTAFKFGGAYTAVKMAVAICGYRLEEVRPQKWQSMRFRGLDTVKKKNSSSRDTKAMALKAIEGMFDPKLLLATTRSRVPHDGIVDAANIMLYGDFKENVG